MKRIEYWKTVRLNAFATFELVPRRIIEEGPYFKETVEAIKASGLDYIIFDIKVEAIEERFG